MMTSLTPAQANYLAARTPFNGGKRKHVRAALPDLAEEDAIAVHERLKAIFALRSERRERRRGDDPLVRAAACRPNRTPAALAAEAAKAEARRAAYEAEIERDRQAAERARAVKDSVKQAARIARSLGYDVRKSTDRGGRVSSYYVRIARNLPPLRISDHEIPETPQRSFVAQAHGRYFYDGYHGAEIVIDRPRSKTWLRRALVLAANGRSV